MTTVADLPQPDAYLWAEITKSEPQEDGTILVYGKPSDEVLDMDDQIADKKWLKQALPEWFKWGNVREMHRASAVGAAQSLEFDENDTPWVKSKIVDPEAVRKVKEGVYKGYSIGIRKPILQRDQKAPRGRFVGGDVIELSLVDRPSVPTSKFDIVKSAGTNEWFDCQSGACFKIGDVHDPGSGNSVDFDSLGDPILQPGHVQDDSAEISIVTMDDRGVVVQMGTEQYLVPTDVNSAGEIVFGKPERLPRDPKASTDDPRNAQNKSADAEPVAYQGGEFTRAKPAQSMEAIRNQVMAKLDPPDAVTGNRNYDVSVIATYPEFVIVERYDEGKYYRVPYTINGSDVDVGAAEQVEQTFVPVAKKGAALAPEDEMRWKLIADLGKAVWATSYIDDLPDSAFAYISPGGEKKDGKTDPRSLRHLPYKNDAGNVDAAHVRDALSRLDQTDIPQDAKDEARRKLEAAAKEVGVEVTTETNKLASVLDAAKRAVAEKAYCTTCKKDVKLGDKVKEEKGVGGMHVTYKGDCGHMVPRFEKADKAEEPDTGKSVPSGMGDGAGEQTGGAVGDPPKNDPGEKQETDIIARMRSAIDKLQENQGNKDDETVENKALADLKTLVNAFVAQQEREATEGDKGTSADALKMLVADAVKAALGDLLPDVAKAGRKIKGERLDRLKDAHKRLGDLIDELHHNVLDDHDAGEDEAAKAVAAERNQGGPSTVNRNQIRESIREQLQSIADLSRLVLDGEGELTHDSGKEPGNLGPGNKPVPPDTKPAGDTWNLTQGDGGEAPRGQGRDSTDMYKTVGAEVAKAVGSQLESVLAPLMHRLETVEHMAVPPRGPVQVAERPTGFGETSPDVRKAAMDQVRADYVKMSPKDQQHFAAQLVAAARSGQVQ